MKMQKNGFSLIELLISSTLILFLIGGTVQLLGLSAAARERRIPFRAARADLVTAGKSQIPPLEGPTSRPESMRKS